MITVVVELALLTGLASTTSEETVATGAVVVVVVVVTDLVGSAGGGSETRCEEFAVVQPAARPSIAQQTNRGPQDFKDFHAFDGDKEGAI